MFKVAVIGAGITGLSVAASLAQRGAKVSLFEALPHVGGVARAQLKHGLSYAPGPQYAWGWEPGGPAHQATAHLALALKMRELPAEFEQLALGQGGFACVRGHIPEQLQALPHEEQQRALAFAAALDSAGRAGVTLGESASFRHGGLRMIKHIFKQELPLAERSWGLRLRNTSVQELADHYGVSARALRMLTHSQGIFAEELDELSALLFASARDHLKRPLYFPEGGFGSLILGLERAALKAKVQRYTSTQIIGLERHDAQCALTIRATGAQPRSERFDHVVWSSSPGVLIQQLERSTTPSYQRLGARLASSFEPSHPITSLDLFVELDDQAQKRLTGRNFTWFEDEDKIGFGAMSAERRAPRTVNFSSPTLNDGQSGPLHVICAFSHSDCELVELKRRTLELLGRLGIKPKVFDIEYMSASKWTTRFGAFNGSLYGRRLTTSSLRSSLCDLMPDHLSLAHSGAAIPGILGCLQLAQATAQAIELGALGSQQARA